MTLEEMQKAILDLQEKEKITSEENKNLKTQLEEKGKREKELEEINQKMFLRLTSQVENKDDKKEEIPSFISEDIYKLLDKNDKRLLKEIENEEE